MIDKREGCDYEGLRPGKSWPLRIIAGALLGAVLAMGCQPSEPKVLNGNKGRGGETLEVKSLLRQDRTTVFDFSSPYCRPCLRLAPILEKLAARKPEVAFVKLNINRPQVRGIDWTSPLARQYKLKSVPYFMIFDSRGKLAAAGPEAQKMVQAWLQETGLLPRPRK